MPRVLIVQEYVLEYRLPFFLRLREALAERGIELNVIAGHPPAGQAARADAVLSNPAITYVPTRRLRIGGAYASWQSLRGLQKNQDLVIVEDALRHLQTYNLLLHQRFGGSPVALWGHGRDYVVKRGWAGRHVKQWLLNRSRWFFVYTQSGAASVGKAGVSPDRVTVVQNSVDTAALERAAAAVTDADKASIRAKLDLIKGATCLFVGALDTSKRLEFLIESCKQVVAARPDFRLIVAGDGPQREFVERKEAAFDWLRYAGRADTQSKALLASVSELILIPGGVGLVAVDSFSLKTPIVTTEWPWHGPEFEYLEPEHNSAVTEDDARAYGGQVLDLLQDRSRLTRLENGCAESATRFSISAMVDNFADGVQAALARTPN